MIVGYLGGERASNLIVPPAYSSLVVREVGALLLLLVVVAVTGALASDWLFSIFYFRGCVGCACPAPATPTPPRLSLHPPLSCHGVKGVSAVTGMRLSHGCTFQEGTAVYNSLCVQLIKRLNEGW